MGATWKPGGPIVVFGDDWGRHVSSMQHVFRHVAASHPVIWVNGIGHRVPTLRAADLRRAWRKARAMLRGGQAGDGSEAVVGVRPAHIIDARVLPWHHRRPVHAFNTWSMVRAIRRALALHGLTDPPVLVTGTPPSAGVIGRLGEAASVYFCMDDFLHLPNVSPEMLGPLERQLLARVDAVVATARSLTDSKRPRSGRSYYLPQGVNYEHFAAPRPVPPELAMLPRPRIGFAGGLTTPVDLALLRRLAEAFPTASIVLVGPVAVDLSPIMAPNVHVLGARPYSHLPAYVQAFDVGIIPYVINPHTIAVDPLKLLEYLAAGIPVTSTDLPEVSKYREVVGIGPTHEQFLAAVRRALESGAGGRSERQALARRHGWSGRAERLLDIIAEVVAAKQGGPQVARGGMRDLGAGARAQGPLL